MRSMVFLPAPATMSALSLLVVAVVCFVVGFSVVMRGVDGAAFFGAGFALLFSVGVIGVVHGRFKRPVIAARGCFASSDGFPPIMEYRELASNTYAQIEEASCPDE